MNSAYLERKKFSFVIAEKTLTLGVSRLAEQATASVLGTYGETAVLVAVTMGKTDRDVDYFPLIVDYEERFYAAGKILGSRFVRREGRASEEAVLSGRLVDRVIRPLFDHRMRREVHVVVTVLAIDEENDPDFVALMTASAALAISEIPWNGPVAGVKLAKRKGDSAILVNPEYSKLDDAVEFVSFIAGTEDRINMIELEGREADEKTVGGAFEVAARAIADLVAFQRTVVAAVGKKKLSLSFEAHAALQAAVEQFLHGRIEQAVYERDKTLRNQRVEELGAALRAHIETISSIPDDVQKFTDHYLHEAIDALVHEKILKEGRRPDGRGLDEIRDLYAEIGLFPRNHGSSVFVRGNTQALAVTTLAAPNAEQIIETIEFSGKRRFLLHYNFPPYSVGEIAPLRGPGRREIGHGALAEKAVKNLIPLKTAFPYTIRVVSEILSSNGSSSMATVCAASLSLMDAGVPIPAHVAGIAMGLMSDEEGKYKILTDIQGPEDHYGDMDCKVAGTTRGITAMQMDVKINGVTPAMLREIIDKASAARLKILDLMRQVIREPRKDVSPHAPTIFMVKIAPEKIGMVIGPGGKIINGIIAKTGALSIDIEENGDVYIAGATKASAEAAREEVMSITKEYAVGDFVQGTVVKILDFGAIVQLNPYQDGMIHISELKNGYVKKVEDVVKLGDSVRVKVIKADADGKIGLSMKNATP